MVFCFDINVIIERPHLTLLEGSVQRKADPGSVDPRDTAIKVILVGGDWPSGAADAQPPQGSANHFRSDRLRPWPE